MTSKFSPFGTASPADLASPISGSNSGVGSSVPPMSLSPGASELSPFGSDPLSLLSETTIGLPSGSIAVPPTVTWLSNAPGAPTASGSTSTVNSTVNESPTLSSVEAVWSMISVMPSPSQPESSTMSLVGSEGGVAKVTFPALTKAVPNWPARFSTSVRSARSTLPVFSMTSE